VKRLTKTAFAALSLALWAGVAAAQEMPPEAELSIDGEPMTIKAPAPEGMPFDHVLSGWLFREPDTQAMEADSFQNPGMLSLDYGEELWTKVEGTAGKSCQSCHGDVAETMKDVGAHYPKWDAEAKRPIDVELQINKCRTENMGAEPYKFDSEEQKAMTVYIKYQSLGTPVEVDLTKGEMQSWWDRGKDLYYRRTGQLNLSCASCHEKNMGHHIRADYLSQGQANGFPLYRLKSGLTSVQNRFRGCIRDTRAEIPDAFSDDLMALELYVTWRGTGLSVETPAVRH